MCQTPYFIIESAHRGCYIGGNWDWVKGAKLVWKPRFRWSIPRTHEAVFIYRTRAEAERELARVHTAAPKAKVYIHEMFAKENSDDSAS